MKVFVTGASGQLGHDVAKELLRRGYTVVGGGRSEAAEQRITELRAVENGAASYEYCRLDITDAAAVEQVLSEIKPEAVIHCAAWTAVDAAEEKENLSEVRAVNVNGTENIVRVCKKLACKLLYISTNYVFDGQGELPWEPEDAGCQPLNVYGQSKLDGEYLVKTMLEKYFIVRIAWGFGMNGNNFVETMLRLGKSHATLRVVSDQISTPTYTPDLAGLLADMAETEKYGCYHATNEGGYISCYEFACEIFRQAGYPTGVVPVTTEEYGCSKAKRPLNGRLEKSKLVAMGFRPLPDWKDALARYLTEWKQKEAVYRQ